MGEQLTIASFETFLEIFKQFSKLQNIETHAVKTFLTGAPSPIMNYVWHLQKNKLETLVDDFNKLRQTQIPMTIVLKKQEANELEDFLKKQNGVSFGTVQGKSISLETFSYVPSQTIQIKEVTPDTLDAWRDISAIAFSYPRECDKCMFDHYFKQGAHLENVKLFLAYQDNKPVGQAMLVLGKNYAINMWSSVLPDYRCRGILTEMIKYRMQVAKNKGYKKVVVQCRPSSASVYDKIGFKNEEVISLFGLNCN